MSWFKFGLNAKPKNRGRTPNEVDKKKVFEKYGTVLLFVAGKMYGSLLNGIFIACALYFDENGRSPPNLFICVSLTKCFFKIRKWRLFSRNRFVSNGSRTIFTNWFYSIFLPPTFPAPFGYGLFLGVLCAKSWERILNGSISPLFVLLFVLSVQHLYILGRYRLCWWNQFCLRDTHKRIFTIEKYIL